MLVCIRQNKRQCWLQMDFSMTKYISEDKKKYRRTYHFLGMLKRTKYIHGVPFLGSFFYKTSSRLQTLESEILYLNRKIELLIFYSVTV